jgi:hypothetical protein
MVIPPNPTPHSFIRFIGVRLGMKFGQADRHRSCATRTVVLLPTR